MRIRVVSIVLAACLAVMADVAWAAPGDLDHSFGGTGFVTTDFRDQSDSAYSVAVAPDGKIVAAGYTVGFSVTSAMAIARYLPDGTLDAKFGGDGRVVDDFGLQDVSASDVAVDRKGRVVVVGGGHPGINGSYLGLIARYLPNGMLDPGFGDGGVVKTKNGRLGWNSVDLDPNGDIVVAGTWSKGDILTRFALARFGPHGHPDPTFHGLRTTPWTYGAWAGVVVAQRNGKILVAGESGDGCAPQVGRFALARYLHNGDLDPTFGGDGRVATGFRGENDAFVAAVAVEPNGRIVAAGEASWEGCSPGAMHDTAHFALVQYLPDGRLDPSFGAGGRVRTDMVACEQWGAVYEGIALEPDGDILVGGALSAPDCEPHSEIALARYTPSGVLDSSFGTGGTTHDDFGSNTTGYALALQPDGRIVMAGGYARTPTDNQDDDQADFVVARYLD